MVARAPTTQTPPVLSTLEPSSRSVRFGPGDLVVPGRTRNTGTCSFQLGVLELTDELSAVARSQGEVGVTGEGLMWLGRWGDPIP